MAGLNEVTLIPLNWFTVETWGRLAQARARSLAKGRLVHVEGRLQIDRGRKDGRDVYYSAIRGMFHPKIAAHEVQFLDAPRRR